MSIVSLLVLGALVGSSQGAATDTAQKVTYTTVAKRADTVLEELSELTHVTLTATRDTADEVLVVKVKDVTLNSLMKQLATACSAAWEKTTSGYKLTRPVEISRREAAEEAEIYAKAIRKAVATAAKRLAEAKPFDDAGSKAYAERCRLFAERLNDEGYTGPTMQEKSKLDSVSPAGRLIDRLSACLDVDALASMRIGERIVFSTSPTRMQIGFDAPAQAAWRQFLADWHVFEPLADERTAAADSSRYPPNDFLHEVSAARRANLTPAKVLFAVSWGDMRQTIKLVLQVVDAQCAVLCRADGSLPVDDVFESLEKSDITMQPGNELFPTSEGVFSHLAQEWSAVVSKLGKSNGILQVLSIPDDLKSWSRSPETSDPLSLHPSELLLALADADGKNLVADVPDAAALVAVMASFGIRPKPEEVRSMLAKAGQLTFAADGGFMVVKPAIPARSRIERVDRASLGMALRTMDSNGTLSLDERAAFVTKNTTPAMQTYAVMAFTMLCSDPMELVQLMPNEKVLRLYGLLGASQRQTLASGEAIPLGKLSDDQKAAVARMLYGIDMQGGVRSPLEEIGAPRRPRIPSQFDTLRTEPTEAFPDGLPLAGTMAMTASSVDVAVAADGMPGEAGYTAESLASQKVLRERSDSLSRARKGTHAHAVSFRIEDIRRFHVHLVVGARHAPFHRHRAVRQAC